MMLSAAEAHELLQKLAAAPSCELHGRDHLRLCLECRSDISCELCDPRACQCWNDE